MYIVNKDKCPANFIFIKAENSYLSAAIYNHEINCPGSSPSVKL